MYLKNLVLKLTLVVILLAACSAPHINQGQIQIVVNVDKTSQQVQMPAGSTVQNALSAAKVTLGSLDRTEPPLYTVLTNGASVQVVRVREEFNVEEVVIPFEHQTLRNESMPEGEKRLVQPGVNGTKEVTYHRVYENDKEISNGVVKVVELTPALPEIMMVGGQAPFAPISIPGRLAYLLDGNAWIIEGTTGNRMPIVTTGDLDGRIFSLSPDGNWLLFTRLSKTEGSINTLWAAKIGTPPGSEKLLVDLKVANVIHYAGWKPGANYLIAYSTVEPRTSAPGWQANNDLSLITLTDSGKATPASNELETNMGGNYGWWGMTFAWSPDGERMAYARPDSVGSVSLGRGVGKASLDSYLDVITLQTRGDWAWVPGLNWGPDGLVIYTVDHVPPSGAVTPEESTAFDLTAIPLSGGPVVHLVSQAGMFAYPLASPVLPKTTGEKDYKLAFLQAIFPNQSESSRYRLSIIDRDGSNSRVVFPQEGAPGLDPTANWGAWSPAPLQDSQHFTLAVLYQKNLWFVDAVSGEARQITGDDLVTRVDWK